MLTAALEERSIVATVPTVRCRVKARPLPRLLSYGYPLFGAKIGVRAILRPECVPQAANWLIETRLKGARHPWPTLWNVCRDKNPNWFSRYWRIRLYDASRSLEPGDYVFQPIPNFTQIPGQPGEQVEATYMRAYMELGGDDVEFTYLDLMWENLPTGAQQLLTPARLEARCVQQQEQLHKLVDNWLWLYRTQRFCRRRFDELVSLTTGTITLGFYIGAKVIDTALLPLRAALRAMAMKNVELQYSLLGLDTKGLKYDPEASSLTLLAASLMPASWVMDLGIIRFDPVIVFEDWKSCRRGFGGVPLALVAHWD